MQEEKAESLTLNLVYYRSFHNYIGEEINLLVEMEFLDCLQTLFMCAPSGFCVSFPRKWFTVWLLGTGCQKWCWLQSLSIHQYISLIPDNVSSSQPNTISLTWLGTQEHKASHISFSHSIFPLVPAGLFSMSGHFLWPLWYIHKFSIMSKKGEKKPHAH